MTTPELGAYAFLPWVRRGLARAIPATGADEPGASLAARVTLPVTLRLEGTGDVSMSVRLHGPGDVTGLDPRQVVRTDPRPGTTSLEPGSMPQVQFARADLPWLFTPATPGTGGSRLRPWLVLVVVRRRDGVRLDPRPGGPLPVLTLASPAAELPDLAHSWAWAHGQVAGLTAGRTPAEILATEPGRACSRLVCPRRLVPGTPYLACVVPAFRAGVQAGLGEDVDEGRLDPAWRVEDLAGELALPVYFSWEFATGAEGSFETLVRRLRPRPLGAEAVRAPRLDVHAPGGGMPDLDPAADGAVVRLRSVLRPPGPDGSPPWPGATRVPFQEALGHLLESAAPGTITAPAYGQAQAGGGTEPAWLGELNLDPRLRVAAAAGARVVQDRQEELMARAWEQAGAVREANALLHRSQLARELGGVLLERHVSRFDAPALLALTRPVHARIVTGAGTVASELAATRVPAAALSPALRRLASASGRLARRAAGAAPVDMVAAAGRLAVAPPPEAPAGMVAMAIAQAAAPVPARPALAPGAVQAQLLGELRPERTVVVRVRGRLDAPDHVWTRPDPLAPVATGPEFPDPMYGALQRVEPALLLPGLEHVEPDSVALLETDPAVIEAYLVGLNHELSRELLWREYPADLASTAFRQFWDVRGQPGDPEALKDVPPIAGWSDTPLGTHLRGGAGRLVLLVRGELLHRYPGTTIYAARASADGTLDAASRLAPMFRGRLDPDVAFAGFALAEEAALGTDPAGPGWYFVFEQHPDEPRFGFDEVAGPDVPQTPDDLAWAHVAVTPSGHADVTVPLLSATAALQAGWGGDAAGMARMTFQQPFRIAIHATRLLRAGDAPQ